MGKAQLYIKAGRRCNMHNFRSILY